MPAQTKPHHLRRTAAGGMGGMGGPAMAVAARPQPAATLVATMGPHAGMPAYTGEWEMRTGGRAGWAEQPEGWGVWGVGECGACAVLLCVVCGVVWWGGVGWGGVRCGVACPAAPALAASCNAVRGSAGTALSGVVLPPSPVPATNPSIPHPTCTTNTTTHRHPPSPSSSSAPTPPHLTYDFITPFST